jgi:threonine/homoserine/homoserine lactone efflux protein
VWLFFIQGVALALPTTLIPSPFKVYLISHSLVHGWRPTLPVILVPLITDGPIILVSLLLLNQVPGWFVSALRIAGGLLILTIAWRLLKLLRREDVALQASEQGARQSLRQALGINLLNPNPYLLWVVVGGPIVLDAWQNQSPGAGLSFIAGFYLAFIAGLAALVLVFGLAGRLNAHINRLLNASSAVMLVVLGIYQIIAGVRLLL